MFRGVISKIYNQKTFCCNLFQVTYISALNLLEYLYNRHSVFDFTELFEEPFWPWKSGISESSVKMYIANAVYFACCYDALSEIVLWNISRAIVRFGILFQLSVITFHWHYTLTMVFSYHIHTSPTITIEVVRVSNRKGVSTHKKYYVKVTLTIHNL